MNGKVTYFLNIQREGDRYCGRIHQGDPDTAYDLAELALGPDVQVTIKGQPYSLDTLTQGLIDFDASFLKTVFDERGQLELGQYLYAETLGRLAGAQQSSSVETDIRVQVITEDEHIARLPWVLLAQGGTFLSMTGWSVALGLSGATTDCELPPSPRMLVVMPQPAGVPETEAKDHLEELEERLSSADHHFDRGRHLQVATTWEAFQDQAKASHHDVFYYYGHGIGDRDRTRLVFAAGKTQKRRDVSVADVAHYLRHAPNGPPLVAYVNGCRGDAGGLLGAGRQLGALIPAVATNRTVTYIDAARKQALDFWRAVLLDGMPPHTAVAGMYGRLGDMGLSLQDVRWMTPVLHGHYRNWKANPPQARNRLYRDPHWQLKLDRVSQFSQIAYRTGQMLRERKPRSLAFVWYGQEGQGVDHFHQRLKVELREIIPDVHIQETRPRWPDDLKDTYRSFEDMLLEAFEVLSLDDIPGWIRAQTRGESGRRSLVYLRHEPVPSDSPISPLVLQTYLEWWDHAFAPLLKEANAFGLLGVSFMVRNPLKFHKRLMSQLDELDLRYTVVHVLDELERLAKKDLRDFVETHNISLPRNRRERILDKVLEETHGHYELTLEALKDLVERAWDLEDEARDNQGVVAEDDEDY